MRIREKLQKKYYLKWKPKNNINNKLENEISDDFLRNMYKEYIIKLNKFIKEIEGIKRKVKKVDFNPNLRQMGGYERCVTNYPDKGWDEKYKQYIQAYKELMVDFLCYPDLDYDELSLKEIDILKEMALFLIKQAEININDLK